VGDGRMSSFWSERWLGESPHCLVLPRIFSIFSQPSSNIKEMSEWVDREWRWNLMWHRNFFTWEEELVSKFLDYLQVATTGYSKDEWQCSANDWGKFTIDATYTVLFNKIYPLSSLEVERGKLLEGVWESLAPSKVMVFSW